MANYGYRKRIICGDCQRRVCQDRHNDTLPSRQCDNFLPRGFKKKVLRINVRFGGPGRNPINLPFGTKLEAVIRSK